MGGDGNGVNVGQEPGTMSTKRNRKPDRYTEKREGRRKDEHNDPEKQVLWMPSQVIIAVLSLV